MPLPVLLRVLFVASLPFAALSANAKALEDSPAAAASTAAEPAQVMLMGMFHFANPGLDMVKSGVIDVMTAPNQVYLEALSQRLAGFEPTDVLTECSPADQPAYDQQFRDFLEGSFDLPSNETYQVGFRVAKRAGLAGVTCFDESSVGWNAKPMFDYMEAHDRDTRQAVQARFETLSAEQGREQATLSLHELLKLASDPARDAENKGLYLLTNAVGAGDGFSGADASASWWHRNFRMYANIQKAAAPGRRVIVIAGQGHTAILKDLLAVDDRRRAEDVRPYLEPGRR
jgi:hypothetical protein